MLYFSAAIICIVSLYSVSHLVHYSVTNGKYLIGIMMMRIFTALPQCDSLCMSYCSFCVLFCDGVSAVIEWSVCYTWVWYGVVPAVSQCIVSVRSRCVLYILKFFPKSSALFMLLMHILLRCIVIIVMRCIVFFFLLMSSLLLCVLYTVIPHFMDYDT